MGDRRSELGEETEPAPPDENNQGSAAGDFGSKPSARRGDQARNQRPCVRYQDTNGLYEHSRLSPGIQIFKRHRLDLLS